MAGPSSKVSVTDLKIGVWAPTDLLMKLLQYCNSERIILGVGLANERQYHIITASPID